MRILKKSSEKQITCFKCGATLLYESTDVHLVGDMEGEYRPCVKCPDCGNNVLVFENHINKENTNTEWKNTGGFGSTMDPDSPDYCPD